MATQLENNTENLQAILMAVSELPSASTANAYTGPMPIAAIKNGSAAYYEATCDEITELYNGLSITVVPDVANTAEMAGLRINGGTIYAICRRGLGTTYDTNGTIPVGFFVAGVAVKLTFYTNGSVGAWVVDDIPYLADYVTEKGSGTTSLGTGFNYTYAKWASGLMEVWINTGSSIGINLSKVNDYFYKGYANIGSVTVESNSTPTIEFMTATLGSTPNTNQHVLYCTPNIYQSGNTVYSIVPSVYVGSATNDATVGYINAYIRCKVS